MAGADMHGKGSKAEPVHGVFGQARKGKALIGKALQVRRCKESRVHVAAPCSVKWNSRQGPGGSALHSKSECDM